MNININVPNNDNINDAQQQVAQPPTPLATPEYKMSWTNLTTTGSMSGKIPSARCNHGVCSIGKYVYCIGGRGEGEDLRFNDTHILDTETMMWQELVETRGDAPVPSSSFSLSVVNGVIYMFGGKHKDGYMNGLYSIHHIIEGIDEKGNLRHAVEWQKPKTFGEAPCPRYLHSASVVGHRIYIFGGCTFDENCLNDLHIFNTRDMSWANSSAGLHIGAPNSRARHAAGVSGNKVYIFGGLDKDNKIYNDVHSFDTDAKRWRKETVHGQRPPATYGHSMDSFGSRLVVFGGVSDTDGESVHDSYILNTITLDWSKAHYIPTPAALAAAEAEAQRQQQLQQQQDAAAAAAANNNVEADLQLPEFRNGHRTAVVSGGSGGSQVLVIAGWHRRYLGDVLRLDTNIRDSHKEYRPSLFAPHVSEIAKRSRACMPDVAVLDNTRPVSAPVSGSAADSDWLASKRAGASKRVKLTIDIAEETAVDSDYVMGTC